MSDLNVVCLIGRLTRDAELGIAGNDAPYFAFSIATRRSRITGGEWGETPHYFNFRLFGEKWRGIGERLKKGCLVSIQGRLEQDKWEQDGKKRSALKIAVERINLLGKPERTGPEPDDDLPDTALPESLETPEAGQEGE
jgi:single-strand DNA-binding protein